MLLINLMYWKSWAARYIAHWHLQSTSLPGPQDTDLSGPYQPGCLAPSFWLGSLGVSVRVLAENGWHNQTSSLEKNAIKWLLIDKGSEQCLWKLQGTLPGPSGSGHHTTTTGLIGWNTRAVTRIGVAERRMWKGLSVTGLWSSGEGCRQSSWPLGRKPPLPSLGLLICWTQLEACGRGLQASYWRTEQGEEVREFSPSTCEHNNSQWYLL